MNQQPIFADNALVRGTKNLLVHPPDQLFGRDADMAAVHLALKAGAAVLLHGMPGAGKTALAAALAAGYAELPGGVLWLDVSGDSLRALLSRTGRALAVDVTQAGDDLDAQAALLAGPLKEKHPLIVLDGRVDLAGARDYVRSCANGLPLLLTHNAMQPGPWTPHAVQPLTVDDTEAMLIRLSGIEDEALIAQMGELGKLLGGHALSISLAARQLAARKISPDQFVAQLPQMPEGVLNRAMGIIMAAYRLLPSTLQGLLLLVGSAFGGCASETLLSDVGGAPPNVIRTTVRQLARLGFAVERGGFDEPHFAVHELVARFSETILKGKKQIDGMQARHWKGLVAYLQEHTVEENAEQYDMLSEVMPNVMAAATWAAQRDDTERLDDLVWLLEPSSSESFVSVRGFRPEYDWLQHLAANPDAVAAGPLAEMPEPAPVQAAFPVVQEQDTIPAEPVLAAQIIQAEITEAKVVQEDPIPEEFQRVEMTPEPVSEPEPVELEPAPAVTSAVADVAPPDPLPAVPSKADGAALGAYQADGSVDDELAALEALAQSSLEKENYADVLGYVDKGMALAQEADNPLREGNMLVVLGDLQTMLGRFEGAESAYQEAIRALRPAEAWTDIGQALDKLGALYDQHRHLEQAAAHWEQAVPIFERVQNTPALVNALNKLGDVHRDMMKWEQSEAFYTRALKIVLAENDTQGIFDQYLDLGYLAEARGDRESALRFYRLSLHYALILDEGPELGETLLSLARVLMDDTVQLHRAVQVLEAANAALPDDSDVMRLLSRARTRQERLTAADVTLVLVQDSLQDYARAALDTEN